MCSWVYERTNWVLSNWVHKVYQNCIVLFLNSLTIILRVILNHFTFSIAIKFLGPKQTVSKNSCRVQEFVSTHILYKGLETSLV